MQHVIETAGLSKAFGGRHAVRHIDLAVPAGSVFAFLGPNGAGKSTTIRLLLGLLRPSQGDIRVHGLDLPTHREEILTRTGCLIESPSVYPHLTGWENLEIHRRVIAAPRGESDRVLQTVGLSNAARALVKTYSLGMKQRLGLALALLGRRDLLILDEPTNGLDPAGMLEVRSLIREMPSRHGMTVFLSTHLLSEVDQIASHVAILSKGQLVFQGSAAELSRRRRRLLRIGADRAADAAALLERHGWGVQCDGDALVSADVAAAPAINRVLVQHGFAVHHLAAESASLEDLFLSMTDAEVL